VADDPAGMSASPDPGRSDTPPLRLERLRDAVAWDAAAAEWDRVATAARAFYLAMPWIRAGWETWRTGDLDVATVWSGSRLVGLAPCSRRRRRWWGLPARIVENVFNVHLCASDVLLEDPRALDLVLDAWDAEAWDAATLRSIPASSRFLAGLPEAAGRRGWGVHTRPGLKGPSLAVDRSWEEFLATRSRNFREQLRRKARTLDAAGVRSEVDCVTAPGTLEGVLPELMQLALRSWKGARGSSLATQPQRSFYDRVLPALAARGALRLWTLRIGGRLAAFDMCVAWVRDVSLLKTSYDPEFAHLSPGFVLHAKAIESVFRSGEFDRYHFLGAAEPYKLQWTREPEPFVHVFVFNDRVHSRALEALEFGVRPRLGAAKRWILRRKTRSEE
jgi:CelD/BcsL family acetyltransferase involved in cellulose biosynthesis